MYWLLIAWHHARLAVLIVVVQEVRVLLHLRVCYHLGWAGIHLCHQLAPLIVALRCRVLCSNELVYRSFLHLAEVDDMDGLRRLGRLHVLICKESRG